jgi:hypothetical protein
MSVHGCIKKKANVFFSHISQRIQHPLNDVNDHLRKPLSLFYVRSKMTSDYVLKHILLRSQITIKLRMSIHCQ